MAEILLSDLTNGTVIDDAWVGDGVFDVLINAVNGNIDIQYKLGRITGSDYAQVYLTSMQAVIGQSIQFLLEYKLKAKQAEASDKQQEVMDSQIALYNRQRESFDDNKYQKLLESQMNYNSMVFAETTIPVLGIATETAVTDVFNKITGKDPELNLYME